ncbi:OpgC domain-containing protein [Pedobacter sp.]|nr:OpgC domain-containing protein [Candidatus Saccharibacteria bacterium]
MPKPIKTTKRIDELDLLRGFFILVIIIDHIQRWPSPLTYLTGEGRLWVSAAEGFFIISGLLIGYLRGHKGLKKSFSEISTLLVKRAATLYLWSVIITFIGVWLVTVFHGNPELVPKLPEVTGLAYIWQVISQQYTFDWIYFLRLYWIMLLVAPLAILLFRLKKWWLVPIISISLYGVSFLFAEPEAALQWQVLFFVPATIGFHLETIRDCFRRHPGYKKIITLSLISTTLITMILSYFWVLGWNYVESENARLSFNSYVSTRGWLDPLFTKAPLAVARVLLAFVWFGGLLALFHIAKPFITKWAGWLLMPFGQYSLTVYCLQAQALLCIQFTVPTSENWLANLFTTTVTVLLVWLLLKIPVVRRVLPQ